MYLYLSVLFFSILMPFVLSFDRKVRFYRLWKSILPSLIIIGSLYIIADILFVKYGIWGFNPAYHLNLVIVGLPIEEWLFFILIPYACVFIHVVFVTYYPNLMLSNTFVRFFSGILILVLLLIIILNYEKTYTLFNFSLLILTLIISLFDKTRLLNRYFISFLIILVPFFLVNTILTGTFIPGEVVWYNNSEILGIRLLTVPIEDVGYAFSMILLNLLMINKIQIMFKPVKIKK
jgi:lycopene cyclase domain-containing protein